MSLLDVMPKDGILRLLWDHAQCGMNVADIGTGSPVSAMLMATAMERANLPRRVYYIREDLREVDVPHSAWITPRAGFWCDNDVMVRVPRNLSVVCFSGKGLVAVTILDTIRAWAPKLSPGGVFVFYDYDYSEEAMGIRFALQEAEARGLFRGVIIMKSGGAWATASRRCCGG